jgi:hypothetical protein
MALSLVACSEEENLAEQEATGSVDIQIEEPNKTDEEKDDEELVETEEPAAPHTDDDHDHEELPFEWAGSYKLQAGSYTLLFKQNEFGDESILVTFILEDSNIKDLEHHAAHIMEADVEDFNAGEQFDAESEFAYNLLLNVSGSTSFTFTIGEAGTYRIFTEHHADEFEMEITNKSKEVIVVENPTEYEGHGHSH